MVSSWRCCDNTDRRGVDASCRTGIHTSSDLWIHGSTDSLINIDPLIHRSLDQQRTVAMVRSQQGQDYAATAPGRRDKARIHGSLDLWICGSTELCRHRRNSSVMCDDCGEAATSPEHRDGQSSETNWCGDGVLWSLGGA